MRHPPNKRRDPAPKLRNRISESLSATFPVDSLSRALLDAFWRAAAYCLLPRVMVLSLLPLALIGAAAALLGYFYWEPAVTGTRGWLEAWSPLASMFTWLDSIGGTALRRIAAPLIVVALAVPAFVVASLIVVSLLMTPAIVRLVATRRFAHLARLEGGGFWQSIAWSFGCTFAAVAALVVSIPLWFVPPLVLIVPPLIWGWLTYRVFAFDVLALHASRPERLLLFRRHRWTLLGMGIVAGYLGALPAALWAVSALALVLAPLLVLASIWLYTLVFAFAALWFAHYLLAALEELRAAEALSGPAPIRIAADPIDLLRQTRQPDQPHQPHREDKP